MTAWQPRRGERVLAVLPDGHEIEGEYVAGTFTYGERHVVNLNDVEYVAVRTVKPLPVTEPTAQVARIIDGAGVRRFRCGSRWFSAGEEYFPLAWAELPQPVRVIDADPDWGDK